MKLLMFYAPSFWYKAFDKALCQASNQERDEKVIEAVVVFYQAEEKDQGREVKVLSKLLKNVKWQAGKVASKAVVLHSLSHLSVSKAPPELAARIAEEVKQRLEQSGFAVTVTPFGYLSEWKMHVAGSSLAKVFKEL
ncbi:Threonyl-tRNA synthetase editing domain-containing protein [Desulfarculales bacterium]